jgi:hypothetical protein
MGTAKSSALIIFKDKNTEKTVGEQGTRHVAGLRHFPCKQIKVKNQHTKVKRNR